MLESIINPIFAPLLTLSPFWAILIISLVIAVLITLVYKLMTDQELMKSLKQEVKQHQKEMKEHKGDPQKASVIQKKAMEKNMKLMMQSMKPTLITFIPIIIIFGWLNSHMAYLPIMPDTDFTTTVEFEKNTVGDITLEVPEEIELLSGSTQQVKEDLVSWTMNGPAGRYMLIYAFGSEEYKQKLLITEEAGQYENPKQLVKNNRIKELRIDNSPLKPLGDLSIFGWRPGWLGTYIILSIIFSMSLRKLFKLH